MKLAIFFITGFLVILCFSINGPVYAQDSGNSNAGASVIHDDWMFQVDGEITKEKIARQIESAGQIADRIGLSGSNNSVDLSKELKTLGRLSRKLNKTDIGKDALTKIYFAVRKAKRSVMFADPLVDFSSILLIDNPYPGAGREPGHEARHRNGFMAMMGGRLVIINGLDPNAEVTTLAPASGAQASFWRPDLSWDGKKIVLSMRPEGEKSFHTL